MNTTLKPKAFVFVIITAVLILSGISFLMLVHYAGTVSIRDAQTVHSTDPKGKDLAISVVKNPEKQQPQGDGATVRAQFDGTVKNPTHSDATHWQIEIPVCEGAILENAWNGVYELRDNVITVYPPPDYNRKIAAHSFITFGFVLSAPASYVPQNYSVTYFPVVDAKKLPLYWVSLAFFAAALLFLLAYSFLFAHLYALERERSKSKQFIDQTLKLFAKAVESKNKYTQGHAARVGFYAKEIAARYGLSPQEQEAVYYSALLLDIGNVAVPEEILNKPGRLDEDELKAMRAHVEAGANILYGFNSIPGVSDTVRHHHEAYNGEGYPFGLSGEEIPLSSRILCAADCLDAMTSARSYRQTLDVDEVIAEFKRCSGTQFDPKLAEIVIQMLEDGILQRQPASKA